MHRLTILLAAAAATAAACGGSKGGGAGSGGSGAATSDPISAAVAATGAGAGLPADRPATPGEYTALAAKMGALPGVASATYEGDFLGTITVRRAAGGDLVWRHIPNTFRELEFISPDTDFSGLAHPQWNEGWRTDPAESSGVGPEDVVAALGPAASGRLQAPSWGMRTENAFATHMPVATGAPDRYYLADSGVPCEPEGKIAIVDFNWSTGDGLTLPETQVDGHDLITRLQWMAGSEAAGFQVDVYKDAQLNIANFQVLQDYDVVFILGHGSIHDSPGLGGNLVKTTTIWTNEPYKADGATAMGITQEQALREGVIITHGNPPQIALDATLFKKHYKPSRNQLWIVNSCWSMLPYVLSRPMDILEPIGALLTFRDKRVYSLGEALKDSGVSIVMGYITPADPVAVRDNAVVFFRRMFGGYSRYDQPPAPHTYWPGCMTPNTYFRWNPFVDDYIWVLRNRAIMTMYADVKGWYFRRVCDGGAIGAHAYLQSFMLQVGTPATALPLCWQDYWSKGDCPNGLSDPLCGQGDCNTTQELTTKAACLVKIGRQATNMLLRQ